MFGLLKRPGRQAEAAPSDIESGYATLAMHRKMLVDRMRCELFREALFKVVPQGGTVLDVGAGTGLLSIFAAQAGARKVYAVEETSIALEAREIIARNGLADRIEVLQSPIEKLEPREEVDVVVSEWLGGFAIDENMLPPVLSARDRWLKPGGTMMPGVVDIWMAPCFLPAYDQDRRFWLGEPYGVDLGLVAERMSADLHYERNDIAPELVMAEAQSLWTIDALHETAERAWKPFKASPTYSARQRGEINGLAAWFSADLGGGVVISTHPGAPRNHWGQVFLPLDRTLAVEQGDSLLATMACYPYGPLETRCEWSVTVKQQERERAASVAEATG